MMDLRCRPHWLLFRLTPLANGKIDKSPRQAKHPSRMASKTDPATWCDYETAVAAVKRLGSDWVLGFAIHGGDLVGFDADGVRDAESGAIDPLAWSYVQRLNSYTEESISGTGVHVIATGGPLPPFGRKKKAFELYDCHMFVVTGRHIAGTPTRVEHRPAEIAALHADIFGSGNVSGDGLQSVKDATPDADAALNTPFHDDELLRSVEHLSDDELLAHMFGSKNGEAIRRLFDGDLSQHGHDHSAADMALCTHLAFWTQSNTERIDRLFRLSKLTRSKWTQRRDYRDLTIAKAVARMTAVYEPGFDVEDVPPSEIAYE